MGGKGSRSAERFLKLDWSAERKRNIRSERGAPTFSQFFQNFPDSTMFSHSTKKKKEKKEHWKPTGTLSPDRKCAERKFRKSGSAVRRSQKGSERGALFTPGPPPLVRARIFNGSLLLRDKTK